jgi:glyceraldehyde-3-phosphate dehydrogenase/erythrose-4-phosphate dehydrogenase
MAVKVAINGFGRIGRNILRAIVESGRKDIEVVALNDLGPVETNAHLLRYDSVHGRFPSEVTVEGDSIVVDGQRIRVTAIKNPAELPHKELGVDIALECTGIFTSGRIRFSSRRIRTRLPIRTGATVRSATATASCARAGLPSRARGPSAGGPPP